VARSFGYINMAPWIVGLGLSQIGEFSFVLARSGVTSGLLSKPTYDLVLTCTVLTMALSPVVANLALPMGRAWRSWRKPVQALEPIELSDNVPHGHVIVAGYGRSGKAAARVLHRAEIPFVVVELSHAVFRGLADDGFSGIWGDITSEQILNAAHAGSARILLLTVPDQSTIHLSVERARGVNATIRTIARAVRTDHVTEHRKLGINAVIQPEFEGGLEMVRQALVQYDGDDAQTSRLVSEIRKEFYSGGAT